MKKQARTPRSQIRSALRRLFLRSRERAAALKRDKRTCRRCCKKHSVKRGAEVYVEVHHVGGVQNWDTLIEAVYECLLCSPDRLETLCKECHRLEGDRPT